MFYALTFVFQGFNVVASEKAAQGVLEELSADAAKTGWTVKAKLEVLPGNGYEYTFVLTGHDVVASCEAAQGVLDELSAAATSTGWTVTTAIFFVDPFVVKDRRTQWNAYIEANLADEPMLQFFAYAHLPAALQEVSRPFAELVEDLVKMLPRNPERSAGLRKLLEAKDCAVRAAIYTSRSKQA